MATITATRGVPTIPGEIRWYPMAVSQTFKKGQFLYLDANGRLTACATGAAGIAGMAEASYSDALAEAGSASTATTLGVACPITLAKRGQQFTLNVCNNGSTAVTAITQIGKKYGLYVASNICYVDTNTTTAFIVDAIAPDNTLGDTTGRLIVEVQDTKNQLDGGTS